MAMSEGNNTRANRIIYADGEHHAEAICKQDLQVQLEVIEKLSRKGNKNVA